MPTSSVPLRDYLRHTQDSLVNIENDKNVRNRVASRRDVLWAARRVLANHYHVADDEIKGYLYGIKDNASTQVAGRRDWNYNQWGKK